MNARASDHHVLHVGRDSARKGGRDAQGEVACGETDLGADVLARGGIRFGQRHWTPGRVGDDHGRAGDPVSGGVTHLDLKVGRARSGVDVGLHPKRRGARARVVARNGVVVAPTGYEREGERDGQ